MMLSPHDFKNSVRILLVGFVLSCNVDYPMGHTFAGENGDNFIEIRSPKKLPAKIPCSRIALGSTSWALA